MNSSQEKSIISNIISLKKRTVNISVLLTKLVELSAIESVESEAILQVQDDEQRVELLYEILLRKPTHCFTFLLAALRESGNGSLAALLEETDKDGLPTNNNSGSKRLLRRCSSVDRYLKEDIGNTLIQDYELGIAEILEENEKLRKNWKALLPMLNISSGYEESSTFTWRVTLLLRQWCESTKMKPNLGTLCSLLEKNGYDECSERIRKMFQVYSHESESGFLFQFQSQANISIKGKEGVEQLCKVLEDNPDFGLQHEKLFLLLRLPHLEISNFRQKQEEHCKNQHSPSNFLQIATQMLKTWIELKEESATYLELAILLLKNGHKTTAG